MRLTREKATEHHYWAFGITMATVCIPFFLLIGSLNSTHGLDFWKRKVNSAMSFLSNLAIRLHLRKPKSLEENGKESDGTDGGSGLARSTSAGEAMAIRLGRPPGMISLPVENLGLSRSATVASQMRKSEDRTRANTEKKENEEARSESDLQQAVTVTNSGDVDEKEESISPRGSKMTVA
jgi:hypothetical protein